MINSYLTIKEASEYLKIPIKYLENYSKKGHEIDIVKIGRRNMMSLESLDNWKKQREFGLTILNKDNYLQCINFAIRSFYHYRSTSDFGTSQQRDAGKFISNFVLGKLGEIAISKFVKQNFDVDIYLDFDLRDAVVGQDIVEIAKPRRGGRVYNPPSLRVAIKTSKMKNVWLIVPQNEAEDSTRKSDIYIYCRVDLYLNHFIRFLKDHHSFLNISEIIPDFEDIQAEVCGFTTFDDLISSPPVKTLPDQDQAIQSSYIMRSGVLKKSVHDWSSFIEQL